MSSSYVDSELRREILFLCGLLVALLCFLVFVGSSSAMLAAGFLNRWSVGTIVAAAAGLVTGRQMMSPAIQVDGYGYALHLWVKPFLRLLWLRRC